jgi:pimeloyl-ACP methyl ester carboxylesterase
MIKRLLERSGRAVASRVDRAVVERFIKASSPDPSPRPEAAHRGTIARLAEVTAAQADARFYDDPDTFFAPPEPARASWSVVRERAGRRTLALDWPSGYVPFHDDAAGAYLRPPENATARARLITQGEGRPVTILVHGYRMGHLDVDARIWPIEQLLGAGLDVAQIVLPHHGPRMAQGRRRPLFPNADPRLTVEGVRQGVHDIRQLIGVLRARGSERVGVIGMSLGGLVSSTLATVDPTLDHVVPMIPLASFADFGRDNGTLPGDPIQRRDLHRALEEVTRVVSPLSRPLAVDPSRALVLAGEGDEVTPQGHAELIARHFGAPLELFHGGHLLQFGRKAAFERVVEMIHSA